MKMKAIIMAGGLGERLRPLTHVIPKPLLPVGEKSVLEITIQKLKEHGFDEIILATSYKSDLFESYFGDGSKFGVKIHYSREKEKLGTAGPLKLVQDKLTEPFLVINGDVLTDLNFTNLANFHKENNAELTLVTKEIELPLRYGVVNSENNQVKSLEEKPNIKSYINAGIYFISPSVIKEMSHGHKLMTDLIRELMDNNKKVMSYSLDGYWLDIGHMEDYEKAQQHATEGKL
jgi:NDP-mannose synthase